MARHAKQPRPIDVADPGEPLAGLTEQIDAREGPVRVTKAGWPPAAVTSAGDLALSGQLQARRAERRKAIEEIGSRNADFDREDAERGSADAIAGLGGDGRPARRRDPDVSSVSTRDRVLPVRSRFEAAPCG